MELSLAAQVRSLVTAELPDWIDEEPELHRRLKEKMAGSPSGPAEAMSYEAFLDWANEDTLAEWVNGEVIMHSPASRRHQEIADFLTSAIGVFVRQRSLGRVLRAPFQMRLSQSGREPDLIYVATEHLEHLKETFLDGPADLVVEIMSPESVGRDRGDKFREYADGGVPEYWLIDPDTKWVECNQLREAHYLPAFNGSEGALRSSVIPGFWLRVEWLWEDPLPSPTQALAEIVGMDASLREAFERALAGGATSSEGRGAESEEQGRKDRGQTTTEPQDR